MRYKVKIRKDLSEVRYNAEQLDGHEFEFREGWVIEKEDSSIYVGEMAMIPRDDTYPISAPLWIASGDLVEAN